MNNKDIRMMVAFDPAILEEIRKGQQETRQLIANMQRTIDNFDKYGGLPDWLDVKTALSIDEVPFTDRRAFYKWTERGVIRTRTVGRTRLYSKSDCIDFLNRRDRWKAGLVLNNLEAA